MADGAERSGQLDRDADTLGYELHFKAIREDAREADFVASTDTVDRYDEVVDQNSWILDDYLKNPVVLFCHQRSELPIGQCTRVAVVGGKLECTIRFASKEANPRAENVWRSVVERCLRAVSVGFKSRTVRVDLRNEKEVYVLSDNELREISVAPIGVNPEALAKMKAKALAEAEATNAARRGEENAMSAEQIKALQDSLAVKEAEQRATSANLVTAQKSVESLTSDKAMLEQQNKALVTERDAAVKRAEEAEKSLAEVEVSALVGKKITAAEKDGFLKLRTSNKALFDEMISQRSELGLEGRVVKEEKLEKRAVGTEESVDLFDAGDDAE